MNKFSTEYKGKHLLVKNSDGKVCGLILEVSEITVSILADVVDDIPEEFGNVYPEHVIALARHLGMFVLEPRPEWMRSISVGGTVVDTLNTGGPVTSNNVYIVGEQ